MSVEMIQTSVQGYGLVFKNVMKDKQIDIEAKALYAYLSAYAGSSGVAFPSVSLICSELNISDKRFKKYRKQLEDFGYLEVKRERTDNGFSKNIYTINHQSLSGQNDTVTEEKESTVSGQIVPVQNVSGQIVPGRNVTGQKVGTIINSSTINSLKNNNNTNNNFISNSRSNGISENKLKSEDSTTTDEWTEVLHAYQNNIELEPRQITINKMVDDFETYGYEIMMYAISKSALKNNSNYSFIDWLLKEWRKNRLSSIEAVKQYEEKGENKKVNQTKVERVLTEEQLKAAENNHDAFASGFDLMFKQGLGGGTL